MRVLANKGAPWVDSVKIDQTEASEAGVKGLLDGIQESLRTKTMSRRRYGASTYRRQMAKSGR